MGILDELKKQFQQSQQPAQQPQQPAQQRRLNTGAQQSQPSPVAEKVNSFFNNILYLRCFLKYTIIFVKNEHDHNSSKPIFRFMILILP